MDKPKPKILKEHVEQEIFVASQTKKKSKFQKSDFKELDKFYNSNKNTDNYHLIFNFFYGDKASSSLEFPTYGIVESNTGFDYSVEQSKNKISV